MKKTPEQVREELVEDLSRQIITEYLEDGVDFLTVTEIVDERGLDYDEDLYKDVYENVNAELGDTLQRYLDY